MTNSSTSQVIEYSYWRNDWMHALQWNNCADAAEYNYSTLFTKQMVAHTWKI